MTLLSSPVSVVYQQSLTAPITRGLPARRVNDVEADSKVDTTSWRKSVLEDPFYVLLLANFILNLVALIIALVALLK